MNKPSRLNATVGAVVGAAVAVLVTGCRGGSGNSPAPIETAQSAMQSQAQGQSEPHLPPFNFEIRTLSNRADLISDGDALVEVQVPKTVPMKKVTLTLNGADVGTAFAADDQARTFRGVLTGLNVGANVFIADSNGQGKGRPWASLTLTNHPRGGRCCSARRQRRGSAQRPRPSPNPATRRDRTRAA